MLADALEVEDVAILDAAMSAELIGQAESSATPVASRQAEPELSLDAGNRAALGATAGMLVGAAFWLVVLVSMIVH